MADHANFTVKTGIDVYFCDPHSPWQRGRNENTRSPTPVLPEGTDLSGYTQPELDAVAVADELNNRPRQTLNWKKPTEVLNTFLVEAA
jgi:IS30 family transposase